MTTNVAVIGAGPWGKNHVRVYSELGGVNLFVVSDVSSQALESIKTKYPETKTTTDYTSVLRDSSVDCVSVCVPAGLHYNVCKEALSAGKHILVEKPLTLNSKEALELVKLAEKEKLVLAVGHIFRFDPTLKKAKEEYKKGTFGKIYYISQARMGLKRPREDCGVIFNYASHDLDILCFFLDKEMPKEITAVTAHSLGRREYEDLAIITTRFDNGVLGYLQVSWLPPKKTRDFWIVGEKSSAFVDTMKFEIEVFKSGIVPSCDNFGMFQLITKEGESCKLPVEKCEPLKEELSHVIDCVKSGKKPVNDGYVGLRTVKMLEAALKSAEESRTLRLDEEGNVVS